jgi:hypothetical protein
MMSFDPKLTEAMAEISVILKKHDIAGAITLVSRTHNEHQIIFPTWSAAQGDTKGIYFESEQPTYPGDPENNQEFEESLNMILQIRDKSAKFWRMMQGLLGELKKYVDLKNSHFDDKIPNRLN